MPKPENKPIIAVDIDEVIFPMVDDLIGYVEREHKVKLTPQDFISYSLEDIWPKGSAEGEIVFDNYKSQVTTEVAPVKGAAEALGLLSGKYDVIVMTARDVSVEPITRAWISAHFPELFKDVHLVGNSRDSVTWRSKAEVCKELGVYCLIDDSLKQVIQTHKAGIKAVLFGDYPWNQSEELPEDIVRARNWREVLEYFNGTGK